MKSQSEFKNATIKKVQPNKKQKLGLWFSAIMLVAFTLTSTSLPVFSTLGLSGTALLLMAVMVFIQVDGKDLLNPMELAAKFNWPVYLFVCFFFCIANFIGSEEAGITATFAELFEPLLTAVPPIAFVIIAMALSTLLTNFMNNLPVAIIFISTMYALSSTMEGINMLAAYLGITMASFAAVALPSSNPPNALAFSNADLINKKVSIQVGTIISILMLLVCIIAYFPILSILV